MELHNLQTKEKFEGNIYDLSMCFEDIVHNPKVPCMRWVTAICLDNGFRIKVTEDELSQIHPHTHNEPVIL